ncbi:hypothetical protein AB5I41_20315 [Sphingomonas sp. MMS24-JH45]
MIGLLHPHRAELEDAELLLPLCVLRDRIGPGLSRRIAIATISSSGAAKRTAVPAMARASFNRFRNAVA